MRPNYCDGIVHAILDGVAREAGRIFPAASHASLKRFTLRDRCPTLKPGT